ncbi:MAG: chemotaxis protein CheB [Methanomicrobiales archaeon HGW-Methanomicrobiales-4]|nr:MAG: chemotaxis protein CheB [Methanomicrobiales archaeon HGW-Methanomicrobiales-4]
MKIVIIGSSTGGPRVLFDIFTDLPKLGAAIIIVQHMPASTTGRLAKRLSQLTANEVIIPEDHTRIVQGTIIVAKGDFHLTLENNEIIHLNQSEKVNFVRPSIDVSMFSLQQDSRNSILGVILSGMGSDGADGLAHLKDISAVTAVQDPHTCTIRSMPESALKTDKVDHILTPEKLKELILKFSES